VAQTLAPALARAVADAPLLSPVKFEKDGNSYHAIALPGEDTQDLGALRLEATDLSVPVHGDFQISLTRSCSSFLPSADVFGKGWTLDLPRLCKQPVKIQLDENTVQTRYAYQLASPLLTYSERFSERKRVPELGGDWLVPHESQAMLGIGEMADGTIKLFFRDGRQWQFNRDGYLIAMAEPPFSVVYRRDSANHLHSIQGRYGEAKTATIALHYDTNGRLISAKGSDGRTAEYAVDSSGMLAQVSTDQGETSYRYQVGRLTDVLQNKKRVRHFEYGTNGRLLKETNADGKATVYKVISDKERAKVAVLTEGEEGRHESAEYDKAFRPVNRVFQDGTAIAWEYPASGGETTTITLPDGQKYKAARSADGRRETLRLREGGEVVVQRDEAGRVSAVFEGDAPILRQEWHPNGLLRRAVQEGVAVEPAYAKNGTLRGVVLLPPDAGPDSRCWVQLELDKRGRPARLTDSTGAEICVAFDDSGEPRELNSKRGKLGIERDEQGKVKALQTSWGYREENVFAETGRTLRTNITAGTSNASVQYNGAGQPIKVCDFDGGMTEISWHAKGTAQHRPKSVRTPGGLSLDYVYDASGRLVEVSCGESCRWQYRYDARGRLIGRTQLAIAK